MARQQTHGALPPPPQAPGQQATHPLHKQPTDIDYPHHFDNGQIVPVGKLVNGCWVVRTSPSVYAPLIAHHANKLAQRQADAEAKPTTGFETTAKPAIVPVPGNAEGVA